MAECVLRGEVLIVDQAAGFCSKPAVFLCALDWLMMPAGFRNMAGNTMAPVLDGARLHGERGTGFNL
jgi:hypothetical protein